MNDDFKNPGLKKSGGNDYYTKLWESVKTKQKRNDELLVNVRLAKKSALLGPTLVIMVQVYSQVLKGRIKQAERPVSRNTPIAELRKLAGVMAAALSEQCSNDYGDNFNAPDYERMGHSAFDQIVEKLERGDLTVGIITG